MGRKMVGILFNSAMHRGILRQKTGQESLLNYEEAASIYGLTPCFLKLNDVDVHSGYCSAYIKGPEGYRKKVIPTPAVIHNRAIYSHPNSKMKQFIQHGPVIFNTCNRYGKDVIQQLLGQQPELRRFLPVSAKGMRGLGEMMDRFPDLILKPCRGSVGNGVMRLVRTGNRIWNLHYLSLPTRRWVSIRVDQDELPRHLMARLTSVPYLVQERIPLAEVEGRPFDMRVTVQRGWGGEWAITGSFAKLAPTGGFVSNIARGGAAVHGRSALESVFGGEKASDIQMAISSLGLWVARSLDLNLPGLADLGLDIGITGDGRLYFIECNGRDQRYGFQKAGLTQTWKDSYNRPMGYARYILESAQKA